MRGAGLFIGVDLDLPSGEPAAEAAIAVVNRMRESGVLISATGPGGNVLKIRPPLVFQPEHADILLGALSEALNAM